MPASENISIARKNAIAGLVRAKPGKIGDLLDHAAIVGASTGWQANVPSVIAI